MGGQKSQSLFFISIIPPEPIYGELNEFKQESSRLFQSKHALKSPPHITLVPPFKAERELIDKVSYKLNEIVSVHKAFPIQLSGFASFSQRVIYVKVVLNEDLKEIYKEVRSTVEQVGIKDLRWHPTFVPHMTIAFKDLRKKHFKAAFEHFNEVNYSASYMQSDLSLLKHNGKKWCVVQSLNFRPDESRIDSDLIE